MRRSFEAILEERFSRRHVLGAAGTLLVASSLAKHALASSSRKSSGFQPVAPQNTDDVVLPKEYTFDVVARWGDSLFPGVPDITPGDLLSGALLAPEAARRQAQQFGANCDAIAFFGAAGHRSDRGTLCVNNEFIIPELAFPGRLPLGKESPQALQQWNERHPHAVSLMKAAHGVSIFEVARVGGAWRRQRGAPQTRRITAETVCEITGPARGSPLLRTKADPTGTRVRGTLANCAGGKTPWGTYLTAEENIDDYFGAARTGLDAANDAPVIEAHRRFPLREHSVYGWDSVDPRFDLRHEPREALRFGWIVEIDPLDPTSTPRKRTALGRFSHEGANSRLGRDGRVAVYMGDDDMFEYVYKFVTRGRFDPSNPEANRNLLDEGTLCVARFDADGTGAWLPLVYDEKGPLNRAAGFTSQADVVIRARAAADVLGATPMDRPEDVEPCPLTGRVYIACTKNKERTEKSTTAEWSGRPVDLGVNAANPRPKNAHGHIIELTEEDAGSMRFTWNVFLLAGDPGSPGSTFLTRYEDLARLPVGPSHTWYGGHANAADVSPIRCPDNLGIDALGRLWIVTDDDSSNAPNGGCFVTPTSGAGRGALRQLLSAPARAEVCGCEFTPDNTTLFLSIQHPGEGGTLESPRSHWPDGGNHPPRSSVIAVRRHDGEPV